MRSFIISATVFVAGAAAQSGAYGQCGGTGWTGATTCVSGYVCTYANEYYSQCVPGTASSTASSTAASTTLATSTSTSSQSATTTAAASPTSTGKFKWFGVDESCAEFGSGNYPGTWGVDFIFPDNSSLQVSTQYLLLTSFLRIVFLGGKVALIGI